MSESKPGNSGPTTSSGGPQTDQGRPLRQAWRRPVITLVDVLETAGGVGAVNDGNAEAS